MSCDGDPQEIEPSRCNYWLKLPRQITTMILQKVGLIDFSISAQLVCTQWHDIYADPSTWATIRLVNYCFFTDLPYVKMIKSAVDRSGGNLFDLDFNTFQFQQLLNYVVERCTQIRRLRILPSYFSEIDGGLETVAARLPLLEHLELVYRSSCDFSPDLIPTLGRHCPRLSSLKICIYDDEDAKMIARNVPQLRHICISGENLVTDVGVEALWDGCPHLQTLDIQKCYILEITRVSPTKRQNFPVTRTQWRDVLENPLTWSTICVLDLMLFCHRENYYQLVEDTLKRVVDKSCGGTVDLYLGVAISPDIFRYVIERCTQIRRLGIWDFVRVDFAEEEDLRGVVARLPLLEHFEVDLYRTLSAETFETLGRCCPRLTSLKIPIPDDEMAKTLARIFPRLHHLEPLYAEKVTEVGLDAFLDGCPDLESLNLGACNRVLFNTPVWIRCAEKVKDLKRPFGRGVDSGCSCCGSIDYQVELDDSRQVIEEEVDNQLLFEDDDVHYTIDRVES